MGVLQLATALARGQALTGWVDWKRIAPAGRNALTETE